MEADWGCFGTPPRDTKASCSDPVPTLLLTPTLTLTIILTRALPPGKPMVCRHCGSRCELVDAAKHWQQLEVGHIKMRSEPAKPVRESEGAGLGAG